MNMAEKILNNAKKLFYEQGLKKTTLRQISKKCDIDHSTIFYYYKSKEEIAHKIMTEWIVNSQKIITESNPSINSYDFVMVASILTNKCIESDVKFANLAMELSETVADIIYETSYQYYRGIGVSKQENIYEDLFNYMIIHSLINASLLMYKYILKGKINLSNNTLNEFYFLIIQRMLNIPDQQFKIVKAHSIKIVSKIDINKINIFRDEYLIKTDHKQMRKII